MINEEILDKEVRVVGGDGEQLGVMPIQKALELSLQKNLDLVRISPNANPPVCKIMDYGKYHFEQTKRLKEVRKNQKTITIKEVRLSATIDKHDLEVKAKNCVKFLKEGDKVKVSIRFRGRQMAHADIGRKVMDTFFGMVEEFAAIERKPLLEGRSMIMILVPKS